jgi:hypothetical protein
VAVSLLAVLLALTATTLSLYAVGVAGRAVDRTRAAGGAAADPGGGQPTSAAPRPGGSTGAQPTTVPTKAPPGELDPQANFTDAYNPSLQKLNVRPSADQLGLRSVDLDRPQVGGPTGTADMTYRNQGRTFTFADDTAVAIANSADVQPKDCAELIRTSGLSAGTSIPVETPDLTLCISTSFPAAKAQGVSWKMVVLHVTAVAADGTVQVDLRAWNIPG